jgi:hypothetical protein
VTEPRAARDFTHHVKCPPTAPLRAVIESLERAGVPCALGGSGLLAALGLIDRVNDWDLTCDADPAEVAAALAGRRATLHGNDLLHADHKLALEAERIEVICRFAFHVKQGVVRLPSVISGRAGGVPLGSPEVWAVAYALLAEGEASERRRVRTELLFTHLGRHGADPGVVRRLLEQPLPAEVAERLRALPPRTTSSST